MMQARRAGPNVVVTTVFDGVIHSSFYIIAYRRGRPISITVRENGSDDCGYCMWVAAETETRLVNSILQVAAGALASIATDKFGIGQIPAPIRQPIQVSTRYDSLPL